jgi:AraC-like DNA-binding protein
VELPPPPALAPYVSCLWVQRVGDGDAHYEQPILPDACIDVVAAGGRVVMAGPATRAVSARFEPGAEVAGVRFRPGTAPPLIGVGASEIRDTEVPVGALWGRPGERLAARAAEATGVAARLGLLVDAVAGRLDGAHGIDRVVTGLAAALAQGPAVPLPAVARAAGLSERQLRRRVETAVGYPPRTLARVLRFQRFLAAARSAPAGRRDLSRLAAESGYADQAHLTRESRRLAGLPPAALLAGEDRRLAGLP